MKLDKSGNVRIVILIAAACFIGMGIYFGGYADTFAKAVKICLECIGIG